MLVLPKKEISFGQPSAKLAFVFRNNAQRTTTFYPVERFQEAIAVPYSIKRLSNAHTGQRSDVIAGATSTTPTTSPGKATRQYTPPEQGFWSHPMRIGVTRTDAGSMCHFVVEFTVPDPASRPNFPLPYPFNLVTIYGNKIEDGRRVDLPKDAIPSIAGDWKPGEPVRLEFDLPKEYADPSQGGNLRFCIGNKTGCMPSSNLLVDSANAPGIDRSFAPASPCGAKAAVDALPPGILSAIRSAVKANDFEEVIRIASKPESGLKVSWLNRNAKGMILGYGVVSLAGCKVSTMGMTVN